MLLSTGVAVLARKARQEKHKRDAQKNTLSVGSSDVAKRAFEGQTQRITQGASSTGAVGRSETVIKYEDPNDIGAESPVDAQNDMGDPEKPPIQDTQRTSQIGISSPVQSEIASAGVMSPTDQTLMTPAARDSYSDDKGRPPSYMSQAPSTSPSADQSSTAPLRETKSISTRSTNSTGTHAVRVKTRGVQLSSGFDYHPSLFDLKVHPEKWAAFTDEVVHTTKVSPSDSMKSWAAATGLMLSGSIVTGIFVKSSMDRSYQERKVKDGISDMSDGGLGSMLQKWNDEYFAQQGLFVHLELSASAMKNKEQKSTTFRKPSMFYSKGEVRDRKEDERKFVIVVTKLDADGAPTEAMREMELNEERMGDAGIAGAPREAEPIAEMPGDTHQGFLIPELPGDDGLGMAELPGGVSLGFSSERALQPPPGFAELEPDGLTILTTEQAVPQEMSDTSHAADMKTSDIKAEQMSDKQAT